MARVNIHDAKTHLSRLIDRARQGEEIVIARAGKPVVKLTPVRSKRARFGFGKGTIRISDDFDAPMPDDWLDLFFNGPLFPDETFARNSRRSRRTAPRKRK